MHTKTTLAILVLVASLFLPTLSPLPVSAAIESTAVADFPQTNTNGAVYAIVEGSDGSVYVGGQFTTIGGVSRNDVARILADGSVDPDFDPDLADGSSEELTYAVRALAYDEQADVLYIGGGFDTVNGNVNRNGLAAVDGQSGVVTSFNPNIIYGNDPFDYAGTVNALAINHDNQTIYAGGAFGYVNGATERVDLAAFSMSTGTVTAFNADISNFACISKTVYDLDYDSANSQLYVAGHFGSFSDTARGGIARVDPETGALDEGYDTDISSTEQLCAYVYSIERYGNTIFAGGMFDTVNGSASRSNLAAFNTTDGTVTSFNPSLIVDEYVFTLGYRQASDTLLIGGSISQVNGVARNELAEVDTGTGQLTDFNPNITSNANSVHALTSHTDGTLYVGGTFYRVGGVSRNGLAAFQDPDLDSDGTPNTEEQAAPNNGDANNDGTPDAEQPHVSSLLNTETNQYVTVVVPEGTTISTASTESAPSDGRYTHLFGLIGFTVTGLDTGATIPVNIYFPSDTDPSTLTARKYFPASQSYQTINGAAITTVTIDSQATLQLSYSLTDGGTYDLDGTTNGQITDPVSLATSDAGALADTGSSTRLSLLVATILMTAGLYKARKVYI